MPFGEGVDQLADGAPGLRKVNPDGLVHQYEAPVPHIIPTQRSIKRGRRTPKTPFPRLQQSSFLGKLNFGLIVNIAIRCSPYLPNTSSIGLRRLEI